MFNIKKIYRPLSIVFMLFFTISLISSCGNKVNNFDQVDPNNAQNESNQTVSATQESNIATIPEVDENKINPLDEEEPGMPIDNNENNSYNSELSNDEFPINLDNSQNSDYDLENVSTAPSMDDYNGEIKYAGATPIAIMPVDMPTPTPRQALEFNYTQYNATNLNLKFEAPSGWEIDESIHDSYVLREPDANIKDDFSAVITVSAIPLSKDYTKSDLNREIKQQLDQLGSRNYSRWSPSNTAKRSLLNNDGIYANFKGTLVTGQRIRGRLHMTVIDRVLYSVQIIHPAQYNEDFIGVFSNIRRTLNFINK